MSGAAGYQQEPEVESRSTQTADERLISLDFIRGFAVLGILAANIVGYAMASTAQGWPAVFGPLDFGSTAAWLANFILIDGKMRSLFAILFGAGLALFIDRIDDRGGIGVAVQARRLLWLALFGIAHFVLLYRGDILFTYAFWGVFAMLLTRVKPGLLFAFGLALYLAIVPLKETRYSGALNGPLLEAQAKAGANGLPSAKLDPESWRNDGLRDQLVMNEGSFAEIAEYRVERHGFGAFSTTLDSLYDSFPMMLIGIALFRWGLFSRGVGSGKLKLAGWGLLAIGVAVGAWFAWVPIERGLSLAVTQYYGNALMPLQRLPMSFAWLFLLVAYLPSVLSGVMGQWIAAAGRMAFSNYICSSLLMALIFQGWGFGWFGRFDRLELFGFVILGWMLMLAWSKPWLARFRYGPLEWLWRCLTYWKLFPIRR
ncbi:DUF418 domain-containing protein [Altererythrobacter sp. MF3-039]|uniref:DUF418 domain-containing protein n=1 Tax=Altererythrobacter sp. MF3-039 TaxID=3252901 RepID=UPI00390C827E